MSTHAFANGRVIVADEVWSSATFTCCNGQISSIEPTARLFAEKIDLEGGWIMPGFVDLQVNGGGGVLFNDDISVEAISKISEAHGAFGTTALLPTLISDEIDAFAAALEAVDRAIEANVPGVIGLHLEGPFLNPKRKGVHEEGHFRRLDPGAIELLTRPRAGVVLVTLAPELCDTSDIKTLVQAGVKVSAGHTDASYDEMTSAIEAGLAGVTHLFNAMSPLHHRDLGVVGAALDGGRLWCGIIADGTHVHPGALRIALRSLPSDRLMLVTDAMPSVGAKSKNFILQGKPITVSNGICFDPTGGLAGSNLDMARAVSNMVTLAGATPQAASAMASGNPASFLGLSHQRGTLRPGRRADWVWLDERFEPRATWIGGERLAVR